MNTSYVEKKNPIISILVPIYNVEAYLQRCIDSVLVQDFHNWELILVDDGSTDRSGAICDSLTPKLSSRGEGCISVSEDGKIKVIHKANGGLISARKAGVNNATGKYYMFLDSDDVLLSGALSLLYNKIQEGFDMVRGGALRLLPDGKTFPLESYMIEEGEIVGSEEIVSSFFTGKVAPYVWGALYRAELFDDSVYDDSIAAGISLGEDIVTNLIVAKKMNRVCYIKDFVYHYFCNSSSIMGTSICSDIYGDRLDEVLKKHGIMDSPRLAHEHILNKSCCYIRNLFIPEFGWNQRKYMFALAVWRNDSDRTRMTSSLDSKFLRFIECQWLYYCYTALYRFLFLHVKQRGHLRKVLN